MDIIWMARWLAFTDFDRFMDGKRHICRLRKTCVSGKLGVLNRIRIFFYLICYLNINKFKSLKFSMPFTVGNPVDLLS